MLASKYGLAGVPGRQVVILDPYRRAAQLMAGAGFLGAALIIRRDAMVRGVTTAATVRATAGAGTACAAGLPVPAGGEPHFRVRINGAAGALGPAPGPARKCLSRRHGEGVLRTALAACAGGDSPRANWPPRGVRLARAPAAAGWSALVLSVQGRRPVPGPAGEVRGRGSVLQVSKGGSADELTP
jgi:hypothetical protein